jgi:hypothetical protein
MQVRAEMALGMMVSRSSEAQVALATIPGAVQQLVALMRSSEDPDAKAIARDLFALLAHNEKARPQVEGALRGDPTDNEDNFI